MKTLKAITILIFLSGVVCSLLGIYILATLESQLKLWGELQRAGMKGAQSISLAELRAGIISHAIWLAITGLLSIAGSVGLFLLKEWARRLWLAVLILLAGINVYWFANAFLHGPLRMEDVIGYPILGVVLITLWLYFTRPHTKDYFRRSDPRGFK